MKVVPLDPAMPKQMVVISEDLASQDEEKLISCLSRNKDAFAWSALDLVGVNRTIIEHGLGINPSVRPKKQQLRKMSDEKTEAAKAEVHHLLEANFIEPIAYPTWLANVVIVQKKSGKWCMCIDFTSLNKACPKDNFPLPRIDKIVDSAAGCEVMSLLDCFSGYHQIYMKEEDKASTSFITPFGTYCFIRMPEGLKNVGSTFSRLTKRVLESQAGHNIFTYVDDIVVARKNKEDHLADLAETFANMRDARLRLNPEKCLRSSPGEDTWLPGVAPRDRGKPNQDLSNHQHDNPTVSPGCPATDRQTGCLEQIVWSTLPQSAVYPSSRHCVVQKTSLGDQNKRRPSSRSSNTCPT
jgi:hypothetical protein